MGIFLGYLAGIQGVPMSNKQIPQSLLMAAKCMTGIVQAALDRFPSAEREHRLKAYLASGGVSSRSARTSNDHRSCRIPRVISRAR